ncbi:hypothetical protein GALL_545580 [mine drainage metagenome]|uniref:Uncharacterized protein n=1 Tax=mine drainage metagenome TaxID=410659 RepID=A0A1J5PF70_9ZZZZ
MRSAYHPGVGNDDDTLMLCHILQKSTYPLRQLQIRFTLRRLQIHKVICPGIDSGFADGIPRHAFPCAEIHFRDACILSGVRSEVLRQRQTALRRAGEIHCLTHICQLCFDLTGFNVETVSQRYVDAPVTQACHRHARMPHQYQLGSHNKAAMPR